MTVEKAGRHLNQVIRSTSPSRGQGDVMYLRGDTLRRVPSFSGILNARIPTIFASFLCDPKLFQKIFQDKKLFQNKYYSVCATSYICGRHC